MPTIETTLFDQILTLIQLAESIDDATKSAWKTEIETNGLSPEMQDNIMKLFQAEADRLGTEIEDAQSMMATVRTIADQEDTLNGSAYAKLQHEVEEDTTAIETEFTDLCRQEVKAVEGIEEGVKAESDQSEADAIRAMLAQKPAENSQA